MVNKQLLKDGIAFLQQSNKITLDLKNDMDTYINTLSDANIYEIQYIEFDEELSENITFDTPNRSAIFTSDGSTIGSLITNEISLSNIRLKAIKLKASNEDVDFYFGYNTLNFYKINSYDISEIINDTFYIKLDMSLENNNIKGIILIYESL